MPKTLTSTGNFGPTWPVIGMVERQNVRVAPEVTEEQNAAAMEVPLSQFCEATTPDTAAPKRRGSQIHGKASSKIPTIKVATIPPKMNAPTLSSHLTLRLNPSRC